MNPLVSALRPSAVRLTAWRVSPATIAAILYREWCVFRRVWTSTMFASIVEPLTYFVAFGYGYGGLVAGFAGLSYREFLATGAIAIGVLFSSMFPSLINGYFRRREQRLYDGVLSTPVSVAELVTGEALWNSLRVTLVAVVTAIVAWGFGVRYGWGALLVPVVSVVTGFGFAALGAAFAAMLRTTHDFDFVIVGVVVPLFVAGGTFFPVENLPAFAAALATANPLHHCAELLRAAAFGVPEPAQAARHAVALVAFDVGAWVIAVLLVRDALVD